MQIRGAFHTVPAGQIASGQGRVLGRAAIGQGAHVPASHASLAVSTDRLAGRRTLVAGRAFDAFSGSCITCRLAAVFGPAGSSRTGRASRARIPLADWLGWVGALAASRASHAQAAGCAEGSGPALAVTVPRAFCASIVQAERALRRAILVRGAGSGRVHGRRIGDSRVGKARQRRIDSGRPRCSVGRCVYHRVGLNSRWRSVRLRSVQPGRNLRWPIGAGERCRGVSRAALVGVHGSITATGDDGYTTEIGSARECRLAHLRRRRANAPVSFPTARGVRRTAAVTDHDAVGPTINIPHTAEISGAGEAG